MEFRLWTFFKDGRSVVPRWYRGHNCRLEWVDCMGGWGGSAGTNVGKIGASLPRAGTPPTPEPGGGGANACPSAEEEVHTVPYLHQQQLEEKPRRTESMKLVLEEGKKIN